MFRHLHSRKVAIAFAALQLTLSVGAAVDLVICREAGGEVVLESLLAGDCCLERGDPQGTRFGSTPDACECTDTPLVGGTFEVQPRTLADLPPALIRFHGVGPPAGRQHPDSQRGAERIAPPHVMLPTVVLLV